MGAHRWNQTCDTWQQIVHKCSVLIWAPQFFKFCHHLSSMVPYLDELRKGVSKWSSEVFGVCRISSAFRPHSKAILKPLSWRWVVLPMHHLEWSDRGMKGHFRWMHESCFLFYSTEIKSVFIWAYVQHINYFLFAWTIFKNTLVSVKCDFLDDTHFENKILWSIL